MILSEVKNEKWINVEGAAAYLGVKPATVREWIRKKKDISDNKFGKKWNFRCSELYEWIQSRRSAIDYQEALSCGD